MHQRHRKICAGPNRVGKIDGGSSGVGSGSEFEKAERRSRGSGGERHATRPVCTHQWLEALRRAIEASQPA